MIGYGFFSLMLGQTEVGEYTASWFVAAGGCVICGYVAAIRIIEGGS